MGPTSSVDAMQNQKPVPAAQSLYLLGYQKVTLNITFQINIENSPHHLYTTQNVL